MSNPSPALPELVSLAGAGRILGVSKQYVQQLAARGELVGTRLDDTGAWAFKKAYVESRIGIIGKRAASPQ